MKKAGKSLCGGAGGGVSDFPDCPGCLAGTEIYLQGSLHVEAVTPKGICLTTKYMWCLMMWTVTYLRAN